MQIKSLTRLASEEGSGSGLRFARSEALSGDTLASDNKAAEHARSTAVVSLRRDGPEGIAVRAVRTVSGGWLVMGRMMMLM